jgi:hypothetical protein
MSDKMKSRWWPRRLVSFLVIHAGLIIPARSTGIYPAQEHSTQFSLSYSISNNLYWFGQKR